jgi:hypothetical protein
MSKQTQLVAELESCKNRHGHITRKAVVERARKNRASALYKKFKARGLWSDRTAAEEARLQFAGELMRRYLTIRVVHRNVKISSVGYVHDPAIGHNVPGMRKLTDFNQQSAELCIQQEIASCEGSIRRARAIAGVLDTKFPGLSDKLERALALLIAARTELHRQAA